MADTPKIDLTIKDTPKMNLSNPYNTFNPLYELVSNKIITEDEVTETAPYFSAEATKEYVTEQLLSKEEIVGKYHDADAFPDDKYLSAKASYFLTEEAMADVNSALLDKENVTNKIGTKEEGNGNGSAPYFSAEATKAYVTEQLSELDKIRIIDISMPSIDSTDVTCNFTTTQICDMIQNGEFVILKVNIPDSPTRYAYPCGINEFELMPSLGEELGFRKFFICRKALNIPDYNEWFVMKKEESSESETVVVNLSLGKDVFIAADKSVSEVYQLHKEGKNVILSFKSSTTDDSGSTDENGNVWVDGEWVEHEDVYKIIGVVGNDIIFSHQNTENPLNFSYVTASIDADTWNMITYNDTKEDVSNKVNELSIDFMYPNEAEAYPSVNAVRGFVYEAREGLQTSYSELLRINYYDKNTIDEKIGGIEEATAAIIALQNTYIGGENV